MEVFLDRQIGMEPLIIDWAKEEAKMAKIIQHIYVYYAHRRNKIVVVLKLLPSRAFPVARDLIPER